MNAVLQTPDHFLLSVSTSEFLGLSKALTEACNVTGVSLEEFESRFGVAPDFLRQLLAEMTAQIHPQLARSTRAEVWAEGALIQMIGISVTGGPADLTPGQARSMIKQLNYAIHDAD